MRFLTLQAVAKRFPGGTQALDGVSLAVDEGEFVVLVGPSGCGKTTLLQIVAGLETPTLGAVLVQGQPVRGPGRDRGMVFQSEALFPWLTALENVAFGLRVDGVSTSERCARARELLEWVGLSGFEALYPHQLSGGMRKMVAIARALAVEPQVLLMDEPFASVDALARGRLQRELVRIWSEPGSPVAGATILFVTHSIREAVLLADRVVVFTPRPGRVQADHTVDIPRPRDEHPLEVARWEREIQVEMGIV